MLRFFDSDFLCQTVPIPLDQNRLIPFHSNMPVLFASNIYSGNIGKLWDETLCMKTWYSSKSL